MGLVSSPGQPTICLLHDLVESLPLRNRNLPLTASQDQQDLSLVLAAESA
jgi:hypothetical protein